jgi:hypothetical protein
MNLPDRYKRWMADTAERVVRTAAQAALPALAVTGWDLDTLWLSLGAAGVCLVTCLAALGVGAPDSASLLPADVDPPQ